MGGNHCNQRAEADLMCFSAAHLETFTCRMSAWPIEKIFFLPCLILEEEPPALNLLLMQNSVLFMFFSLCGFLWFVLVFVWPLNTKPNQNQAGKVVNGSGEEWVESNSLIVPLWLFFKDKLFFHDPEGGAILHMNFFQPNGYPKVRGVSMK